MQRISHGTRAYILNADGLKAFIIQSNPVFELKRTLDRDKLESVTKFHEIDIASVVYHDLNKQGDLTQK